MWIKRRSGRCGLKEWGVLMLGLIIGAPLLAACSRPGDLSGEFYYTTRGGDVKRLADHEILLVKATPEFEAAWKEVVTRFKEAYEPANTEYEEASRREGEARLVYYRSLSDSYYRRGHDEAQAVAQRAREQRDEVVGTWRSRALQVITASKVAQTRTNAAGRFEFRGVAPSRYYLFATAEVPMSLLSSLEFVRLHWWVPVELRSGAQTVDLTMNNIGEWPLR